MELSIAVTKYDKIEDKRITDILNELNTMYTKEFCDQKKVAYYYEDKEGNIFSFNKDICFYAASSIKILACLLMYKSVEEGKFNLDDNILITLDELKPDTGIIKYNTEDTYYTIRDLIKLCIIESDNTAYLKLMELLGKDNVEAFGKSLGALHTMEGKDSFGITSCSDMMCYWKAVKDYIETGKYGKEYKEYLLNPSVNLIDKESIDNLPFVKKYGSWDIAYHEGGYVESENEYFLLVYTQINKEEYKEEFINKTAKLLNELNKTIRK